MSYLFNLALQVNWGIVIGSLTLIFSTMLLLGEQNVSNIESSLYVGLISVLSFGFTLTKNVLINSTTVFGIIVCVVLYCAVGLFFAKEFVRNQIKKEEQRFKQELPALKDYCVKKLHANVDAVGDHTFKMVNICFDRLNGKSTVDEYKSQIAPLTKIPYKVGISQDLNEAIRQELVLKWVAGHSLDFLKSNPKINQLHSYFVKVLFEQEDDWDEYISWIGKKVNTENVFSLARAYVFAWPVALLSAVINWIPTGYKNFKQAVVDNIVENPEAKYD